MGFASERVERACIVGKSDLAISETATEIDETLGGLREQVLARSYTVVPRTVFADESIQGFDPRVVVDIEEERERVTLFGYLTHPM